MKNSELANAVVVGVRRRLYDVQPELAVRTNWAAVRADIVRLAALRWTVDDIVAGVVGQLPRDAEAGAVVMSRLRALSGRPPMATPTPPALPPAPPPLDPAKVAERVAALRAALRRQS
jgi:hypothetical protein